MNRGLLIVFSGPSGVGKDSILKPFMQAHPECVLSVSATTRPPRPGEEDGVDYYFLSREQFREQVAAGRMLEYAEYSGNCYGTPRDAVNRLLDQGRDVILEIELKGAMQVRASCPDAVFVFVMPPSLEELYKRLSCRGTETDESLEKRMRAAREEMDQAAIYDYIIVNRDIEESVEKLAAVVVAARCATKYNTHCTVQEEKPNA